MIRPKGDAAGFLAIADGAARIRVLGCSSTEAALVGDGMLDAFVDAGSRTHRLVDLAATSELAVEIADAVNRANASTTIAG